MATSQEFQNLLRSGKIADAMTLALSEMIELKIRTRVVPADADGADGDRPGYQMQTRINIVDGDIDNEVGSLFLKEGPYSELRSLHTQQVVQAQEIIRTNIESIQALLGVLIQGVSQTSASRGFSEPTPIVSDETPENAGMGMGLMGVTAVVATGAAVAGFTTTAGFTTDGFTPVSPAEPESVVDFSNFSATEIPALESLEPIALGADALEPDRFSGLVDGGADDEDYLSEAIEAPLEALSIAVEPTLEETEATLDFSAAIEEPELDFSTGAEETVFDFTEESEASLDFSAAPEEPPADLGFDFAEESEAALDLSVAPEESPADLGFDFTEESEAALDLSVAPEESPADLGFDFAEESEAALDLSVATEEPPADLGFDTPEEPSLDFSPTEEETAFDLGEPDWEDAVSSEASPEYALTVSDSSDATPEWSIEDSVNLGEEMSLDPMPATAMLEEGLMEDDNLDFLDFEEPNDFDIPADLPDPLADLPLIGRFMPPDFLKDTPQATASETIDFGFDLEENLESSTAYDFGITPEEVTLDEDKSMDFGDNFLDPIGATPSAFDSDDWDLGQEESPDSIASTSIHEGFSDQALADSGLGLSAEEMGDFDMDWAEETDGDVTRSIPEGLGDPLQFADDDDLSLGSFEEDALNQSLDAIDTMDDLDEMDDFETGQWDEAQAGTPIAESGLSPDEDWNDAADAMGGLDDLDDLGDFEDMALLPGELPETSISLNPQDPLFGEAMGVADVDAMDSLFQNSENNLDLSDFQIPDFTAQATSDLDPFDLEMDDPFEEVLDLEEDPFASLSMDDTPPLPPPPPRPRR